MDRRHAKDVLVTEALASPFAGFAAYEFDRDAELAALAAQVLDDPVAFEQVCDRVLDLMRQDLRRQQERSRGGRQ